MFHNIFFFFFSSRRRHTRSLRDWSSDVCSSDLWPPAGGCPTTGTPRRSTRSSPRAGTEHWRAVRLAWPRSGRLPWPRPAPAWAGVLAGPGGGGGEGRGGLGRGGGEGAGGPSGDEGGRWYPALRLVGAIA